MIDYEKELNQSQREAVLYDSGPALVIAGAGSGKTRVLTYKLAHLIEEGYKPWRLMALTFTNKAADEMKTRVNQLVGGAVAREMMVGTFHSVFARILRRFAHLLGYNRDFTIYDTVDSKSLIKSILKDFSLDPKVYPPNAVLAAISDAKNHLQSPLAYAQDVLRRKTDNFNGMPRLYELYGVYADFCRRANAMDFDDLLYQFNVLLKDFPDARRACQESIDYLLVDEYQDTNAAQYLIARQLVEHCGKIFVVGDDAQSIYSFRGAQLDNILLFTKSFAGAKIFKLEQNYRSTQRIVQLANGLIEKNRKGIPKKLFSTRPEGEKIIVNEYNTGREEAAEVVLDLFKKTRLDPTLLYSSFAILYRTNAQSRLFEEQLRQYGIPYRIYGGTAFYSRAEIKNILAYLRLIINPNDDISFARALSYPKKGIGDKTQAILFGLAATHRVSLYEACKMATQNEEVLKSFAQKRVQAFCKMLEKLFQVEATSFYDATKKILDLSGIWEDLKKDSSIEGLSRLDNTKEFLSSVSDYDKFYKEEHLQNKGNEPIKMKELITSFVESVSLISSQESDKKDTSTNKVTLMTVHAAKGLEFHSIYITGMEEGIFPSIHSFDSADLEEERRLFYVAITRAKDFCTISMARTRMRNGSNEFMVPSSFLKELDTSLLHFKSNRLRWELDSAPQGKEPSPLPESFFYAEEVQTESNLPQFNEERVVQTGRDIPSRPQNSLFKVGDRVSYSFFGEGTVIALEGEGLDERVKVRFDNGTEKNIILRFSKLVPI